MRHLNADRGPYLPPERHKDANGMYHDGFARGSPRGFFLTRKQCDALHGTSQGIAPTQSGTGAAQRVTEGAGKDAGCQVLAGRKTRSSASALMRASSSDGGGRIASLASPSATRCLSPISRKSTPSGALPGSEGYNRRTPPKPANTRSQHRILEK
eukprot:scaffold731_cov261-Pinguiococcus_pyrenoidosus.AAC.46